MSDLISRDETLKVLRGKAIAKYPNSFSYGLFAAANEILDIPAVDAVPVVHAHWKFNRDGSGTCSNCRRTQTDAWDYDSWDNYCSSCGAKMDGGKANATD